MSAKFQVDAVFSIEGRGTVLQGTMVNGEICNGMRIAVSDTQSQRRIVAVEGIHGSRIPTGSVGLVLDDGGPDDVKKLRAWAEGRVLDIYK